MDRHAVIWQRTLKAVFVPSSTIQQTWPIPAAPPTPFQMCVAFSWPSPSSLIYTWGFIRLGEGGTFVARFWEIPKEEGGRERGLKINFPLF